MRRRQILAMKQREAEAGFVTPAEIFAIPLIEALKREPEKRKPGWPKGKPRKPK